MSRMEREAEQHSEAMREDVISIDTQNVLCTEWEVTNTEGFYYEGLYI